MSHYNGSVTPSYPPTGPPSLSEHEAMDSDVELEDEVDQLDSDSESPETDTDDQDGTGGVRIPGSSLLPPLRLENIINADGVTGNLALSKEGLFILSVATEEFIKRMAQAGQLRASAERRNLVNYSDMCATTQQYQEFMFLSDTIPAPISLADALSMREAKEKELFDDDPTLSTSSSQRPSTSASAPPTHSKTKLKVRNLANGHGSVSARPGPMNDADAYTEWADTRAATASLARSGSTGITIQNGRLSLPARPSPLANGHLTSSTAAAASRSGTLTSAASQEPESTSVSPRHHQPPRSSPLVAQEEGPGSWPGQYTGPASGFLQGPGAPFGRPAQNPGRTIYSQQAPRD
ncbi:hypothetical protein DXG03_006016 [Asterophora parasitica]|uniref:Transcription factor CBF/NF-Y/archaeal histone domain-containing protein n=1 Tax=Asterophora parasitica TaxID=117018 RepID=A0A9P7G903_9AGAR|nr:hypothetical protein DXG03_006016 [Asterophora parasitica]